MCIHIKVCFHSEKKILQFFFLPHSSNGKKRTVIDQTLMIETIFWQEWFLLHVQNLITMD